MLRGQLDIVEAVKLCKLPYQPPTLTTTFYMYVEQSIIEIQNIHSSIQSSYVKQNRALSTRFYKFI